MELLPLEDIMGSLASLIEGKELIKPETDHYFSDGVCVREMRVKAGTLVVGAEHKTNHITMLIQGTMQIRIGDESKLFHAPCTFEALAGSRKIGFAYTDCVVSNIIPTHLTDTEEIEKMFTTLHEDKKELLCQ